MAIRVLCGNCDKRHIFPEAMPYQIVCPCGNLIMDGIPSPTRNAARKSVENTPDEPQSVEPVLVDQWPTWARLIAKRRREGEVGVGDTVSRYAAKVGGERFKRVASLIGIPCGCTARQEQWNTLYPYAML